jgi:hypothetical protein
MTFFVVVSSEFAGREVLLYNNIIHIIASAATFIFKGCFSQIHKKVLQLLHVLTTKWFQLNFLIIIKTYLLLLLVVYLRVHKYINANIWPNR